ncbi:hypothetical protein [Ferrimonas marina]|uniref:hypothetical protein n=1 Tax=Ferrimonas marina TaxID=299255 RepID=UPI000A7033DF|nr:hypothetical protein [Ferrimonas marina]
MNYITKETAIIAAQSFAASNPRRIEITAAINAILVNFLDLGIPAFAIMRKPGDNERPALKTNCFVSFSLNQAHSPLARHNNKTNYTLSHHLVRTSHTFSHHFVYCRYTLSHHFL